MPGLGGVELISEGSFKFSLDYYYEHADKLRRGKKEERELQETISVKNTFTSLSLSLEYGLTDQITLRAELPYKLNLREEGYKDRTYDAHGVGDLVIGGRYWLFDPEPDPQELNFYGQLNLGIPTGEDDERIDGEYKKAYIQVGSGQWTPMFGVGFYKGFEDLILSGGVGYLWSMGENDAEYDSAEVVHSSLGLSYVPLRLGKKQETLLGVSLFATGLWITERDTRDGQRVNNTGGTWIDLAPGFFLSPDGGAFTAYVSVPIRVYRDLHSLQCDGDYAVSFGISHHF